jgi:hypothetical protein
LAACLLVALVSAPTIDAIVCQDDATVEASQLTAAAAGHLEVGSVGEAPADLGDVCPHGHCHHGVPYVPAQGPTLTASFTLAGAPPPAEHPALSSQTPQGLLRPPRA